MTSLSESGKPSKQTAYERWEVPNISAPDMDGAIQKTRQQKETELVTAAKIEEIQKQAWDEGFAQGHQEGIEKGLEDARVVIEQKLSQLDSILNLLAHPLEELDDVVIEQTAELAMAVARQLVRRELRTDPGQIIAVVREAINELPVSARKVRVMLHPDDASLVREAFSRPEEDEEAALNWRIVEEPLLQVGDCKVVAENSSIDATVEKRLNRVIAQVLGGERADDKT